MLTFICGSVSLENPTRKADTDETVRSSLEFPPLSICVNIYALRLGSYYLNPTEYRGMNIAHPLCAGYKNRLLIYTYAQCVYANHDLALNWYM